MKVHVAQRDLAGRTHETLPPLRLVQGAIDILEFLEVVGPERFGNFVLLVQPFPEIDQLAPLRAKRTKSAGKPIAGLLTRWTTHRFHTPSST